MPCVRACVRSFVRLVSVRSLFVTCWRAFWEGTPKCFFFRSNSNEKNATFLSALRNGIWSPRGSAVSLRRLAWLGWLGWAGWDGWAGLARPLAVAGGLLGLAALAELVDGFAQRVSLESFSQGGFCQGGVLSGEFD